MGVTIWYSVGAGGFNAPDDAVKVQGLLNAVPVDQGGPLAPLVVDGLVGPKTTGAIYRYQSTQFGWADGRVDPGGATIGRLGGAAPGGAGSGSSGSGRPSGGGTGASGRPPIRLPPRTPANGNTPSPGPSSPTLPAPPPAEGGTRTIQAVVESVTGLVAVGQAHGESGSARAGMALYANATVNTLNKGQARIRMTGGGVVDMPPKTLLVIYGPGRTRVSRNPPAPVEVDEQAVKDMLDILRGGRRN
ncbi:hypothetical protein [Muricoccus radiodurans]|uniref:hypothetical protein n=1 Tax=Muricoccus radiodurans TaxID=2231721 RepID=UPI003CF53149